VTHASEGFQITKHEPPIFYEVFEMKGRSSVDRPFPLVFRYSAPKAFTLLEVVLACAIFTLFSLALFSLFRSGQLAGNQSYWLQKTAGQLRNLSRYFSATIQKSSYPSTIVFPQKIVENSRNEFKIHVSNRKILKPEESKDRNDLNEPGTQFLRATQSIPEKKKFENETPAVINYHIYSLTKTGKILYHRYSESLSTTEPLYVEGVKRTRIPPEEAHLVESLVLVEDVESVKIEVSKQNPSRNVINIEVTCANPKGKTKRSDSFSGVPNVEVLVHPFDVDW